MFQKILGGKPTFKRYWAVEEYDHSEQIYKSLAEAESAFADCSAGHINRGSYRTAPIRINRYFVFKIKESK